jgi:hypothetical protein
MSSTRPTPFLRFALYADALASAASGLLMAAGAGQLERLLGIPAALLQPAGLILLPYAALVAWLGSRENVPTAAVWTVIACNVLWAADCAIVLASGWLAPTALGYAFVIAQALTVLVFAELQYVGLRRSAATPAVA